MNELDTLLATARDTFHDPTLTPTSRLMDARGYDSLTHVGFMLDLEERFGVSLVDVQIDKRATLESLLALLVKAR